MKYVNINATDLHPSAICLGSMNYGSKIDAKISFTMMDMFCDFGGNFIDTANVYANWLPIEKSISEKTIGKWMKERNNRNNLIVATKGAHPELSAMHIPRLSHQDITNDLDESLQSLQTDYIDLYWLHRDDENRPVSNILETLNDQVKAGKIRYFGCSNWKTHRIKEAINYASQNNMQCFVGNQMMWSLAAVNVETIKDKTLIVMDEDMIKLHKEIKLAAIPYSSQAHGFFTKLDNANVKPLDKGIYTKYYNNVNVNRLNKIKKLASELSVSINAIALAYLISQPFTTIPIAGPGNPEQLKDSMKAADIHLSDDILNYLEKED